jgi:hypothetical protein
MRNRAVHALAVLLPALFVLFLVRNAPLLANRDDFLRLYFGGYVGCATLAGGAEAKLVKDELAVTGRAFGDEYRASRFIAAQTPYSPLTLGLVCAAERARSGWPGIDFATWALGVQTLSWLGLLAAAAALTWRALPERPLALFVAMGLTLVWMHVHTSPFVPAPRGVASLATALALVLVLTGRGERWAHLCAVVAAFAHPYNQALNLGVATVFVLAVAGTAATGGWRPRMAARVALTGAVALGSGFAIVRFANPRGVVSVSELFGYEDATLLLNWAANRLAVYRLVFGVGLALVAMVFRYAGARRAAVVAGLFLCTVGAPALLWPAGLYPGEVSNRVGGAWVAVLFALVLRGDLVPDFSRMTPRGRTATVAAIVLAAGAGAVPEILGIRSAPHYAPWLRHPRVETLPGVERECLALMERRPLR